MRTAMQLMLWYLENEGLEQSGAYYKAKMLLEKEKEQILAAYNNGQSDHHFSLESRTLEAEQHYNQTYNQNK